MMMMMMLALAYCLDKYLSHYNRNWQTDGTNVSLSVTQQLDINKVVLMAEG